MLPIIQQNKQKWSNSPETTKLGDVSTCNENMEQMPKIPFFGNSSDVFTHEKALEKRSSTADKNRTRKSDTTTPYTYDSDKIEVLKIVKSIQGKASTGNLIFLRNDHRAGLGYISIPSYYIKFDFSIDTNKVILPLYCNRDEPTCIIDIFDFAQSEVANYINLQLLNAFRRRSLQREAGENIPIYMKVTSLFLI